MNKTNLISSTEEACGPLPPPPPPLPPSLPLPPTPSKRIQANGRLHLKNANWEKIDSTSIVGTIWEKVHVHYTYLAQLRPYKVN